MRSFTATVLATTLLVTNAFAAPAAIAPLPAGKPAGVSEAAQLGPNFAVILLGLGITIGGLILATSKSSGGITTPTTTSTSP